MSSDVDRPIRHAIAQGLTPEAIIDAARAHLSGPSSPFASAKRTHHTDRGLRVSALGEGHDVWCRSEERMKSREVPFRGECLR